MEVEVGSFSDPEGLEGLAHLLGEFTASLLLLVSSLFTTTLLRFLPLELQA